MAENKDVFPLNLTEEFRTQADTWLHAELGVGPADLRVLRDLARGILITRSPMAAELYALDVLLDIDPLVPLQILFREGRLDSWDYQIELVAMGRGQRGVIQQWFTSDHLCRIVTRLVDAHTKVELVGWPCEWPKPASRVYKAA